MIVSIFFPFHLTGFYINLRRPYHSHRSHTARGATVLTAFLSNSRDAVEKHKTKDRVRVSGFELITP